MALKTKVKAGNITNLSDARYCSGMGVDFIGFPVSDQSSGSDIQRFQEIRTWISGPEIILEWTGAANEGSFIAVLPSLNVDFVEINVSLLERFPSVELPLIVALTVAEWTAFRSSIDNNRARIRYLIISSDSGAAESQEIITAVGARYDVLLKLNALDSDLGQLLALNIKGIALSGSPEEKPGVKDYLSISDVLEKLEVD